MRFASVTLAFAALLVMVPAGSGQDVHGQLGLSVSSPAAPVRVGSIAVLNVTVTGPCDPTLFGPESSLVVSFGPVPAPEGLLVVSTPDPVTLVYDAPCVPGATEPPQGSRPAAVRVGSGAEAGTPIAVRFTAGAAHPVDATVRWDAAASANVTPAVHLSIMVAPLVPAGGLRSNGSSVETPVSFLNQGNSDAQLEHSLAASPSGDCQFAVDLSALPARLARGERGNGVIRITADEGTPDCSRNVRVETVAMGGAGPERFGPWAWQVPFILERPKPEAKESSPSTVLVPLVAAALAAGIRAAHARGARPAD